METLILLIVLVIVIGAPVLVAVFLHHATKPLNRAIRNHHIEKQLREDVADAEAQQRAAQKLLRERGQ